MPVSQEKAQSLCSETEWKTVVNSFPPKISAMQPAVAKKNASRVSRFLAKAEAAGESDRVGVFQEALERLQALLPAREDDAKQTVRREKEAVAKKKAQAERNHRAEVREKLAKKAEEEEAAAEASEEAEASQESED